MILYSGRGGRSLPCVGLEVCLGIAISIIGHSYFFSFFFFSSFFFFPFFSFFIYFFSLPFPTSSSLSLRQEQDKSVKGRSGCECDIAEELSEYNCFALSGWVIAKRRRKLEEGEKGRKRERGRKKKGEEGKVKGRGRKGKV